MLRFLHIISCLLFVLNTQGQMHVMTIKSPEQLVKEVLVGDSSSIIVGKVTSTGNPLQFGHFKSEAAHIDIKEGIILSTGYAKNAMGPNNKSNCGSNLTMKGSNDLTRLANNQTFDAAILQFDFIPLHDQISFDFVFASEEYPEYVNKGVNDVFAFFLIHVKSGKRTNLAVVPETNSPVTIDEINHLKNSEWFIYNEIWDERNILKYENKLEVGEYALNFQYDGLTTWLNASSAVIPGDQYVLKMAIADAGDGVFDSAVLLKKNSFSSVNHIPENMEKEEHELVSHFDSSMVKTRNDSLVLTLHLHFLSNSSELNEEEDFKDLMEVIEVLRLYENIGLKVEGFTDGVGDADYNLELSNKRAQFAHQYILNGGIESTRLSYEGFGMKNPVSSNQTEGGRAMNRRVEFVFYTLD